MARNVYLLATNQNDPYRDMIYSRDTGLKIRVCYLDTEIFYPDVNEIQLFAYCNDILFTFETVNIASEDAMDIVEAIQWYADYIKFPDMQILAEDPRLKDIAV